MTKQSVVALTVALAVASGGCAGNRVKNKYIALSGVGLGGIAVGTIALLAAPNFLDCSMASDVPDPASGNSPKKACIADQDIRDRDRVIGFGLIGAGALVGIATLIAMIVDPAKPD